MQDIKVSVIMPVYKVEKYVARAIESILARHRRVRVLIVDDGSPDNSGKSATNTPQGFPDKSFSPRKRRRRRQEHGNGPCPRKILLFYGRRRRAEPTMLETCAGLPRTRRSLSSQAIYRHLLQRRLHHFPQVCAGRGLRPAVFQENAYKLLDSNLLYTPWNKL